MTENDQLQARRWLDQALADLRAARDLDRLEHHNLACFHSQQAAEKALKGLLYSLGAKKVLGHSVQELSEAVRTKMPEFESLVASASRLDKYYVATRYPNGLPGGVPYKAFGPEDAQLALDTAQSVLDVAAEVIDKRSGT